MSRGFEKSGPQTEKASWGGTENRGGNLKGGKKKKEMNPVPK